MTTSTTSVTPDLMRYMANARTSPVPSQVLVKAKNHVLDTIAAMVSGTTIKPGIFAIRYIGQQGGNPEAQVVGSGIVTSAINAAMANGMLAHSDETDDSNGSAGIHPGCAVIPAALAMAERENASGDAFLRAVILGYDIGSRTTKALGRDSMRARNHLPFSIGGMPARNGVTAATMLQSGYTGVDDVFVGDGNFLAAFADSARAQELTAELGSRYEVMLTNIKKYCVGFPIQSAIEGLLGLMAEHQLRADQVERITARLPESGARTVNDREMPDVNLQYAFAVTLLDGKLTFEAAHSFERMKDPRVLDLKKRVTLIGDPELSRARPEGQSVVQVITRDGRRLEKRVTTFKGRSENPLTTYEVEEKALELLEPVLGQSRTRQLMDAVGKLETLASVRDLRPLLRA